MTRFDSKLLIFVFFASVVFWSVLFVISHEIVQSFTSIHEGSNVIEMVEEFKKHGELKETNSDLSISLQLYGVAVFSLLFIAGFSEHQKTEYWIVSLFLSLITFVTSFIYYRIYFYPEPFSYLQIEFKYFGFIKTIPFAILSFLLFRFIFKWLFNKSVKLAWNFDALKYPINWLFTVIVGLSAIFIGNSIDWFQLL